MGGKKDSTLYWIDGKVKDIREQKRKGESGFAEREETLSYP